MAAMTLRQARRVALASQGFGADRSAPVTRARVAGELRRIGQFQIDSVSVLARAHLLPVFSRRGCYDRDLVGSLTAGPVRAYEYWGHEASLLDIELYPAMRWRMDAHREHMWGSLRAIIRDRPDLVDRVREEIVTSPLGLTARQILVEENRSGGGWWQWSAVKTAAEYLFRTGGVAIAGRTASFERVYADPARVIPARVRLAEMPPVDVAQTDLVRTAARALGIATSRCLGDYFRMSRVATAAAVDRLVATGELVPVTVAGWSDDAYLWHAAPRPRARGLTALVSPFDSLVFERTRLQGLFGTDYRLEIYTPAAKRRHGYYVYLVLMDDGFAARVDLKADRAAGLLIVRAAWHETDHPARQSEIASRLAGELDLAARWLGLGAILVEDRGDLAQALRVAVAASH